MFYTHNHLRIRRILTHLNNVGFRKYAIELVKFFEAEIYGGFGGYAEYKTTKKFLAEDPPLKELADKKGTYDVWSFYGEAQTEEEIKNLEKNSMMKYPEDFVQENIYFSLNLNE